MKEGQRVRHIYKGDKTGVVKRVRKPFGTCVVVWDEGGWTVEHPGDLTRDGRAR